LRQHPEQTGTKVVVQDKYEGPPQGGPSFSGKHYALARSSTFQPVPDNASWIVVSRRTSSLSQEFIMLWTIFATLVVLWLLGIVSAYTFGGFIHVLLAVAVAVVLMRVIQGQQPMD
jgi:hypothetical protein